MEVASLFLVVLLGSIILQQTDAQLLTGLNNIELIDDFLRNFPEATIDLDAEGQNITGITTLEYYMPIEGILINIPSQAAVTVRSDSLTITGKSFIGGKMEISIKQNTVTLVLGNNSGSTFLPLPNVAVNESIAIDVINLSASVSRGANGYDVNELRVLFMPVNTPLPYNITANDRAMAIRIKIWLNNKLPAVVKKYEDYISELTAAGILNLSERLL